MAVASLWENALIRNPSDWLLQQFLEVWSVQLKKPYDVFELPPQLTENQMRDLQKQMEKYSYIVSSIPWKGAWEIGKEITGSPADQSHAGGFQQQFLKEIGEKGWQ
jgi:hypothetical protein